MPFRDDCRVLDFDVKGKGSDAEQVIQQKGMPLPLSTQCFLRVAR